MELATLIPQVERLLPEAGAIEVRGMTADSRAVRPGYLFAALPGTQIDGAKFIPQALAKGASAVLTHEKWEGVVTSEIADEQEETPVIGLANPRKELALAAARFYGRQPEVICAVTGTNGKTSIASFARQIWSALGQRAASLGTLGLQAPESYIPLGHTTPDPIQVHRTLYGLSLANVHRLALEASSHGLEQHRLDGVKVKAAAFSNLTHEHLDYHETMEEYLFAKVRLFGELMSPGGVAVLNADAAFYDEVSNLCWARGIGVLPVGQNEEASLRIVSQAPTAHGQEIVVRHDGEDKEITLPLVGTFQAMNALMAAGLVMATGEKSDDVLAALENLEGARGRIQFIGETEKGASIFVDYAHTPDALQTVLEALRPHTNGNLNVIFGCGGDRDMAKRPAMGKIAAQFADHAIVTDDNPRSEDAATIRSEILAAMSDGHATVQEIGDRGEAIASSIATLGNGDLLIVAGKGHETGQIVGNKVLPFSDIGQVEACLKEEQSENGQTKT